uniref:Uncharacterized protein n=1 Tax=Nicotiana tabacum TaxID=4097 RepID=A0A1S4D6Z2_TOBAC|nr:PREDICTED: uncharacterized protein LOC107826664 [Nicotiana tabacum]
MDEPGYLTNETMYRGIIGSLLYLTASRRDILFSTGLCARFQSNPKESHLKVAKRTLRYLKRTQDLVLYYHSGENFDLIGYADVDYAGYLQKTVALDNALKENKEKTKRRRLAKSRLVDEEDLPPENVVEAEDEKVHEEPAPLVRKTSKKTVFVKERKVSPAKVAKTGGQESVEKEKSGEKGKFVEKENVLGKKSISRRSQAVVRNLVPPRRP